MSSKRGRKRNDNLPPNRARDVQRAFRARRAAHLQALEQRVTELEDENTCLRQALNLPPANRVPLGKGPTGKDKPKNGIDPTNSDTHSSLSAMMSRSGSSSGGSPSSTRTGSLSPTTAAPTSSSLPPRGVPHALDASEGGSGAGGSGPWSDSMLMEEHHHMDLPSSSTSSSFHLPPMSATQQKALQYSHYSTTSSTPSSRSSIPNNLYMSYERPMSSYSTVGSATSSYRGDSREDPRQYTNSFSQPNYHHADHSPLLPHQHQHSVSPHLGGGSHHLHHHHQSPLTSSQHHSRDTGAQMSYPSHPNPRRSQTDPQGAGGYGIVDQYPTPSQNSIRLPSSPSLLADNNTMMHSQRGAYGSDAGQMS